MHSTKTPQHIDPVAYGPEPLGRAKPRPGKRESLSQQRIRKHAERRSHKDSSSGPSGLGGKGAKPPQEGPESVLEYPETFNRSSDRAFGEARRDSVHTEGNSRSSECHKGLTKKKFGCLRRLAQKKLPFEGVAQCGRQLAYGSTGVECYSAVRNGVHSSVLKGTVTCKSSYGCLHCAQVKALKVQREIDTAVTWWRGQGGRLIMVTLTSAHDLSTDLRSHRRTQTKAFSRMSRGRPWRTFKSKMGLEHHIRKQETTFGMPSGFHPHLHVLFFIKTDKDLSEFDEIFDLWRTACVNEGMEVPDVKGFKVVEDSRDPAKLSGYMKPKTWGPSEEMSGLGKSRGKSGYTQFELLEAGYDAEQGGDTVRANAFYDRFKEYYFGMKGAREIYWSKGLKKMSGVVELDDDDVFDEDELTFITEIEPNDWYLLLSFDVVDEVRMYCEGPEPPGEKALSIRRLISKYRWRYHELKKSFKTNGKSA